MKKINPIVGKAQGCVNPAVVNNYNKTQEFEADKLASQVSASCMNFPIERQVIILQSLKVRTRDGGGFCDRHPSWDERIANIQGPDREKGEAAFDKLNPQ
jgi:Zn-dependent protease with chaperone function